MDEAKTCKGCGISKPLDEYYFYGKKTKRRGGKCKECTKAMVRANRAAKIEYYRQHDRDRAMRPDRLAARISYSKTPRGIEALRRASSDWNKRNPRKRQASSMVSHALRDGKLTKMPCEVCGVKEPVQAHHDDYSKPLDVRWLCVPCHAAHHKEEREKERQTQIAESCAA